MPERHEIIISTGPRQGIWLRCSCRKFGQEFATGLMATVPLNELVEAALEHDPNAFYRERHVTGLPQT